jgi:hypothetical protein
VNPGKWLIYWLFLLIRQIVSVWHESTKLLNHTRACSQKCGQEHIHVSACSHFLLREHIHVLSVRKEHIHRCLYVGTCR